MRTVGLRMRVTLAFGFGALLLSATLAVLTYELARTYLMRQRETSVLRQTYVSARLVKGALRSAEPDIPRVLASLETPAGSNPVLLRDGRWFAASLSVGRDALPAGLRDAVESGEPSRQRFVLDGTHRLAVGVPLPSVGAAYFEVFTLDLLDRTLRVLRNSLVAAAAVTTVAGAAVGRAVSRRVLRPVAATALAAADVAGGRLDVQIDPGNDPDLARLANSFNRMTGALRERIEREERFAAAVTHELRSPLTTLAATVEVLRARRHELSARGQSALDLLAGEVHRFEGLVQDLLEISRLDAGASETALEDIRLGEFVLQAVGSSGRADLPLDIDGGTVDLIVRADKRRLERVIANLLENAASHGGGATRLAVERSDHHVRLAVEDGGPGVPAEERERIFERFVRGRAGGRRGAGKGTGLGLSLVAEHVRQHGGRVWVEDRPGGGARFVVELPTGNGEP